MSTLTRAGSALALAALALALGATSATADPPTGTGDAARNDGDQTQALRDAVRDPGARNVILLIGDGMGDSEITVARNYLVGAAGELPGIDALPVTGQYTTYSLHADDQLYGLPDYTPDSAATGTAWATGTKSYDGAISVDLDGADLPSLLEIANANGLRTGDVSTAEIQDATPAVQVASVTSRRCYGPSTTSTQCPTNALENGGAGSISEQLLDTRADVTLGGGAASFDETAVAGRWAGQTLWQQATDRGYQVVRTAAELAAVTSADAPVLGLFTPGNFPTRFAPAYATAGGGDAAPITCSENPDRLTPDLSLAALTTKAIDLLDSDAENGFFLQVEGASIDKRDHAADACGQIGETQDLDEAVQVALDFAAADGNTLVIVTADHAHTSQIVDATTPGLSISLTTADGAPMLVSYGTAPQGGSQQHTGSQLRVAAYGPGAANVAGLTDQTDTFFTIADALGLERDLATLSADATVTLPESVAPGQPFEIRVAGLAGDKTLSALLQSDPVDLGASDVVDGSAVLTATAPTEVGEHTVTVTGTQTGVSAAATFQVVASSPSATSTATATATAEASPTDPAASTAAAVIAGGGGSGSLPGTGAQVLGATLVAAALIALGLLLVRARRIAHAA